jgi:hypothetical protein
LQIQFLKPLFGRNSSTTYSQHFPSWREIFTLTVAFVSIGVLVAVYLLGDWNLGTLPPVAVAILIALLQFGFGPRLEKRFKKSEQELDLGQHTESLCKEVYEPLLDIFVGQNPSNPYKIEYKVHSLNELGNRTHRLIPAEELRYLDRGIDHLRNYKAYPGAYRAWEEALILKRRYNDKHEELNQEIKKMAVEKAQEYLPLFSEYESARSPAIQSYFRSEGFVNAVIYEIQGLLKDPNLKVNHPREFTIVEEKSDKDGHWWWSLVWWYNTLLRSRHPFTNQDQDNLRQILIESINNPKIAQIIRELFELDQEIHKQLYSFKGELKAIVEKIKDKDRNYFIQGKCTVCR